MAWGEGFRAETEIARPGRSTGFGLGVHHVLNELESVQLPHRHRDPLASADTRSGCLSFIESIPEILSQARQVGMAFAKVDVVLRTNVARMLANQVPNGRRTRQAGIPYSRVLVFDEIVSVHIDFDERIVLVAITPREDDGKTISDCPVEPFTVIEQ